MAYFRPTTFVAAAAFLLLTGATVMRASDALEVQVVLARNQIQQITPGEADFALQPDNANELVLGVSFNGEARAYPISILNFHEIVNDVVGGLPIAATYCPLCATGVVFDRRVGGSTLDFEVSGRLLMNNLIMIDRQTESLWPQVTGTAISGPLEGSQLQLLASQVVAWSVFVEVYPNATVLQPPGGRAILGDPYAGYSDRESALYPIAHYDTALPTKDLVYGLTLNGQHRAYPLHSLALAGVLLDDWNGIVVVGAYWSGAASFFLAGNHTFQSVDSRLMRDETGRQWFKATGEPLDPGPANATVQPLERLLAIPSYWFSWKDFHPDTTIYNRDSQPSTAPLLQRFTVGRTTNLVLLGASVFVVWTTAGAVRRRRAGIEKPEAQWHAPNAWAALVFLVLGVWFLSAASEALRPINQVALGVPAAALLVLAAYRAAEAWSLRRRQVRYGPFDNDQWLAWLADENGVLSIEPAASRRWPHAVMHRAEIAGNGWVEVAQGVIIRERPRRRRAVDRVTNPSESRAAELAPT